MSDSILIVDDEKPVRYMMRRLLEGDGYSVTEADSAEGALEVLGDVRPDLVITDLKMPGMDGLTLAQKLIEADADRPVLMMTAYADLESARRAVQVGIYEYFIKPVDVSDVTSAVKRALERRRLIQENREYQQNLERMVEERTRQLQEKVQELEARDRLLSHMLSIHEPEETLGLAVNLALGLCQCDAGVLYTPDAESRLMPRAAVGFAGEGVVATPADLEAMGLEGDAVKSIQRSEAMGTPVCVHDPGEVREGYGLHSYALLPVKRNEDLVAVLEVGRKRKDALVGRPDLESLQDFLTYVAMAVADCELQDQMPGWGEDVEQALKASEEWTE